MMSRLRQLGGLFSLISREDGRMMHEKRDFKCKDAALIDTIMTNDAIVDGFDGRITKHHRRFRHNKLLEDACTIERCKNMMDFLLITRNEFTGIDAQQKESIFGKSFDNIDCPSVVNVCFRCCTLGQTFNDNFSLTRRRKTYDGYLKCGQTCSGCEVLLANNKSSFFDECIVQHFHSTTVNAANLCLPSVTFRDIYDLTNDEWNPVTYQHSQMNMSGELMTFAVGGPRFSHNGVLTADNTTNNGLVIGVFRDCRHVALAPLFRYHYELPTNPSAKYIDQHMAWLVQMRNQVLRREDPFQDADEYGYVAMQLTHLPRLMAFDAGNMLTFGEDHTCLSEEAVNRTFLKDLNREFRHRTDMSAIVQREPLNEPSVYVVNRRSLLTNKPQVFYNDDSSFVYSTALATNALKWSESVLGDCSEVFSSGELFKPIRTLALNDVDKVKLCVFGKGRGKDVMFSYCPPINDDARDVPTTMKNWIFENGGSHIKGLEEVCL